MEPVVKIEGLKKTYRQGTVEVPALLRSIVDDAQPLTRDGQHLLRLQAELDLKLIGMYAGAFRWPLVLTLLVHRYAFEYQMVLV